MEKSRTSQPAIAAAEISHVVSVRFSRSGWRGLATTGADARALTEQRPQRSALPTWAGRMPSRSPSGNSASRRNQAFSRQDLLALTLSLPPRHSSNRRTSSSRGCFSQGDVTCATAGYARQEILGFKQPATLNNSLTGRIPYRGSMCKGR